MCSKTFSTLSLFSCPGSGSSFATAVVGGFATEIFTHKIDRWSVFEPGFFFFVFIRSLLLLLFLIHTKMLSFLESLYFLPQQSATTKNNNNLVKDYEIVATIDGVKSYFFNI